MLRIKESLKPIYENVSHETNLEGNRYALKLPFKEDHPVIPENYSLSEKI